VEYQYRPAGGPVVHQSTSQTIQILSRNQAVSSSLPLNDQLNYYDAKNNLPFFLAAMTTKDDRVMGELAGRISRLAGGLNCSRNEDALRYMETLYYFMSAYIAYQTPPADFFDGKFAQHVKYGRDVLRNKAGTCIDLAILYTSACEAVGLEPVLFTIPGHVFPAVRLPESRTLVGVETTMIRYSTFNAAVGLGRKEIGTALRGPHYQVNVLALHNAGVRSLPLLPADLTLKDLEIPADDEQVKMAILKAIRAIPTPKGKAKPKARPDRPAKATFSPVGTWTFSGRIASGHYLQWKLTLDKKGGYASALVVRQMTSRGMVVVAKREETGTYKVGEASMVFHSVRGDEVVVEYRGEKDYLLLVVPDPQLGKLTVKFVRVPV
jgi:hypothetical protein